MANGQYSRRFYALFALLLLSAIFASARTQAAKILSIYVIDVEGGNATLVVTPSGESVLIDTGYLQEAARDAGRIMAATQDAGIRRIDHLITTHWHLDHFGGMAELADRIPILEFIDHGPTVQHIPEADAFLQHTYPRLYRNAKHTVAKVGDLLRMARVEMTVVSSAGETIRQPLPDAGSANPYCRDFKAEPEDRGENAQSIGIHLRFGTFRAIHLGDLSTNKEAALMCPNNLLGKVDLFVVSHHGQLHSNNQVLVNAIESRAAVMNNGIRKGGEPEVMKVIHSAPGLEDLWQLHFSELSGQEYTVPGMFIANWPDTAQPFVPVLPAPLSKLRRHIKASDLHNGTAYWIKVLAAADGTFTVTNSRNSFSKTYTSRPN